MPKILIASRDEAVDMLGHREYNKKITAIVSISDHAKAAPKPVVKSQEKKDKIVLTLHFDDMVKEMIGNPRCNGWEPPRKKYVLDIIEHAKQMLESGGWILCHCNAGISRSPAAAFIIKCIELGPGKEKEALTEILKTKSMVSPNEWMVEFADEILGPDWNLMEALSEIQTLRQKIDYSQYKQDNKQTNAYIVGKGEIKRI